MEIVRSAPIAAPSLLPLRASIRFGIAIAAMIAMIAITIVNSMSVKPLADGKTERNRRADTSL